MIRYCKSGHGIRTCCAFAGLTGKACRFGRKRIAPSMEVDFIGEAASTRPRPPPGERHVRAFPDQRKRLII